MQVLITGGAGFIGSHSAAAALAAGCQVRVLDDLSTGSTENLASGVDLVVGDVTDPACVAAAVEGCDAVLHLAALVSVPQSLAEPSATYHVNTTGTTIVLDAARSAGVMRFVLASTCAVYGDLPGCKDENAAVQPLVPYAASKLMAEQWAQVYSRAYAMETAVLRYFNVYGPRQRADSPYSGVIARWCAAAAARQTCTVFGDGSQTRDFVSVHDVARANLLALTHSGFTTGGVYTVATGNSASLNDLLDALAAVAPYPVQRQYAPARPGDILHSAGNSDRLQAQGWRPQVGLRDGLAEILKQTTMAR